MLAVAERLVLATAAGDHGPAEDCSRSRPATPADAGAVEDERSSALAYTACAHLLATVAGTKRRAGGRRGPGRPPEHALPWLAVQVRLELRPTTSRCVTGRRAGAQLDEIDAHPRPRPGRLGGRVRSDAVDLGRELDALVAEGDGHSTRLTSAELRLVPLLATHLSFREIGDRLFVSRNTIKTQAISIYRKLGALSRSAAIERAVELGLVGDPTESPEDLIRTG